MGIAVPDYILPCWLYRACEEAGSESSQGTLSWWRPPSGSSPLGPRPSQISSRGPCLPAVSQVLGAAPSLLPLLQLHRCLFQQSRHGVLRRQRPIDGFTGTPWTPPLLARIGASQGVALPVHRVGQQLAPRSHTLEIQCLLFSLQFSCK